MIKNHLNLRGVYKNMFSEKNYNNLPELVKKYLLYLVTVRNRSQRTAGAYAIDLRSFFKFYKLNKKLVDCNLNFSEIQIDDVDLNLIKKITLLDVYEFLNFAKSNNNSAKARARKASSIRGFFKYLTLNLNLLEKNPVKDLEIPSVQATLPKYLSIDESVKLLEIQYNIISKTKLRDYCILTLFLNCGMRLSELAGINLKDFKIDDRSLRILGKGNKERVIFLNDACITAIENYLKLERQYLKKIQNKKALFLSSRTGNRLGTRQIQNVVEVALKNANLDNKGYSPHKLRHTAATLLYQHGNVDILILKELLGHVSVGTTEIYTHVSNEMLKKAVSKNPLNAIKNNNNNDQTSSC